MLPILNRGGSIDHEFRDCVVSIAEVKPSLVAPMPLDGVKSAKELDRGGHLLFSAEHFKPHQDSDRVRNELSDPNCKIPECVSKKPYGRHPKPGL